jgi:hypothetical protein
MEHSGNCLIPRIPKSEKHSEVFVLEGTMKILRVKVVSMDDIASPDVLILAGVAHEIARKPEAWDG